MRRAVSLAHKGEWPGGRFVAEVTLPFEERNQPRVEMTDDQGRVFMLDMEKAVRLNDGDGLVLEDGGVIRVAAALEAIADINCADAQELARFAWHLGNRHILVEVLDEGTLRIRDEAATIEILQGIGATITRYMAPFSPEAGAYSSSGGGQGYTHDH